MKQDEKPKRDSESTARSFRSASGNASRRSWWLVLLVVVISAGLAITLTPRRFWRNKTPGSHSNQEQNNWLAAERGFRYADSQSPVLGPTQRTAVIDELVHETIGIGQRLLNRFPNQAGSLGVMAHVQRGLGDGSQAVALWEKCVELDPDFVDAYVGMGSVFFERGDCEKAEKVLRKALALDPVSPQASFLLANALLNQGKMEETVSVLEKSIESNSSAMPSYLLLGQAYLQLKQYAKAKRCFESAIRFVPDYGNAYYGLATTCARLGDKEQSRQCLEQFKRIEAMHLDHRIDQAKRADDEALARRITAETYLAAGTFYYAHGDVAQAEDHLRRAVVFDPNNTPCLQQLAWLHEQQGRPRDTLEIFTQIKETQSQNVDYWIGLGGLHVRLDEFDGAEDAYRRAVELAPQRPEAYTSLAQLYLQSNRKLSQASELAKTAVELQPTASHYFLLGVTCQRNGNLGDASQAIEKAMKLDPRNPQYRQAYLSIHENK